MVAPLLGLPVKRIRVVKPRIGGGFGGKQEMLLEDVVGHLVLATRRPVRLELTREEEFVSSRIRHAQTITFRSAVDGEGRLLAQDHRVVGNTGPYATHGFTVQSVSGQRGLSQYNCPAKRYTADVAYTNRPVAGAFRGYGAPQALFALESHMDDIARSLGLDPIELRRKNWVRTGDPLDILPALGERGAAEVAGDDAAGDELRHRRVRRAGRCAPSAGSAATTRSGSNRRTGRTSGGGSASPCACRRPRSPTSTWVAPRSR